MIRSLFSRRSVVLAIFPRKILQWLGPLVSVGVAAAVLAAIVVSSGWADLAASKPHPDGWARFLHFVFKRSTAHHAPDVATPADLDAPFRIAAGAAYYGQVCAHCHAGPGLGQNPVVLSMRPRPQYLASDLVQPDNLYTPQELFRILKGGVKYSAMPSWPADGRDDEIWHMVAFLRALPKMSPVTFRNLAIVAPSPAPPSEGRDFGPPTRGRGYALRNDAEPPAASFAYRTPALGFAGYALTRDPRATCARCHGADGAGGGIFPNLTIQEPDYLARTLYAFAQGRRRSGFMQVVASELSPQQIKALAAYYAALPRRATETGHGPVPTLGQQLALAGEPAKGLGPCAGCHGVNRAAGKAYPSLEGQDRWYVANQMRVFRAGGRGQIEGQNPMVAIAGKLDDREIEAVSTYYAAQPPNAVQSFAAIRP